MITNSLSYKGLAAAHQWSKKSQKRPRNLDIHRVFVDDNGKAKEITGIRRLPALAYI
jgi:hypothetical protein